MRVDVLLPQWGMGMQEGLIVEWLYEVGDSVEEGEPMVEVEAEKATDLVRAPATGTIAQILVQEGEEARVGTVLAILDATG